MSIASQFVRRAPYTGEIIPWPEVTLPREDAAAKRRELLNTHSIETGVGAAVFLNSTSRIAFLMEAQEVMASLYGCVAIEPETLKQWAEDPAFTTPVIGRVEIAVMIPRGHDSRTSPFYKSREEQAVHGWNNMGKADVAVTHVGFLLDNEPPSPGLGADLFSNSIIRTLDSALYYNIRGLQEFPCDDRANFNIGASAYWNRAAR